MISIWVKIFQLGVDFWVLMWWQAHSTSRLAKREELKAPIMVRRQDDMIDLSFFLCVWDAEAKRKENIVIEYFYEYIHKPTFIDTDPVFRSNITFSLWSVFPPKFKMLPITYYFLKNFCSLALNALASPTFPAQFTNKRYYTWVTCRPKPDPKTNLCVK